MCAASGKILGELRKLKIEEHTLTTVLDLLKNQLNRLKIEELALAGKIRTKKTQATVFDSSSGDLSAVRLSEEEKMTVDNPEDINKITLDLTAAERIFSSLPLGQDEEEEEEEEDNDDEFEEAHQDLTIFPN